MSGALQPGLRGTASMRVGDGDTAAALGSGDVPVLGTPRVVALLEAAAVDALRGRLDPATTSVGTAIAVEHLRASAVGTKVEAAALLEAVEGRTLRFSVRAWDGDGDVARATHVRVVVDRERFLAAAGRVTP